MGVAGAGLAAHGHSIIVLTQPHLFLGLRTCHRKHRQSTRCSVIPAGKHISLKSRNTERAAAGKFQDAFNKAAPSYTAKQARAKQVQNVSFDKQRQQVPAVLEPLPVQGNKSNSAQELIRHTPRQGQTPQQTAKQIRSIWYGATSCIRQVGPMKLWPDYIKHMDTFCSASESQLNALHFSAVIYGTAQVYLAAESSYGRQWQASPPDSGVQDFFSKLLTMTPRLLPNLGCREISSILWSFSKLQLDPEELQPGIVDRLCQRFIDDIENATDRSYSSLLRACCRLQLDPCKGALVTAISQQLGRTDMTDFSSQAVVMIMRSLAALPATDASPELLEVLCNSFLAKLQLQVAYEPKNQAVAYFTHALAKMPQAQPSPDLLHALCDCFLRRLRSQSREQRPGTKEISMFIYSFVSFPQAALSTELLDALCDNLLERIQSPSAQTRPTAQGIALFAWALQKHRHVPSPAFAAAMLSRMLYLCGVDRLQPTPQNTSNLLIAYADLRLAITNRQADILVRQILACRQQSFQALTNTAWSLAVSGLLQLDNFKQLLHAVRTSSGYQGTEGIFQLYQAWEWLLCSTPASPQNNQKLQQLQVELQTVGPRPDPVRLSSYSMANLLRALSQLGLQCQPRYAVAGYLITAVVLPTVRTAPPIFVTYFDAEAFANQPDRLTGRVVFCRKLLLCRGILIEVPRQDHQDAEEGVMILASYLAPRLEAATEGKLATYYM